MFLLLLIAAVIGSCTTDSQKNKAQYSTNSNDEIKTAEPPEPDARDQNDASTENSSIETDIQFIRDKYNIISQATDYKTVPFEIRCDGITSDKLERKYNKKGELSYLKHVSCGEHGCRTKHHYYWEGELIFIFQKDDFTPGVSHVIKEHRTYFKNGQMIRCLEKKARYYEGQAPMAELLKEAENKEVDCTPEKLSTNLSEIESLSLDEAQKYFCPSSESKAKDFSLTNGKLGYPSMSSFFFDINFDGEKDSLVVFPGEGQRGRTDFIVYDLKGNELIGEPYNQMDSETRIDIAAKEVSIFTSGGACGSITDIYQPKDGDLRLVKRLKQNMEDGKCMESTYEVSNGTESFVSKKELMN